MRAKLSPPIAGSWHMVNNRCAVWQRDGRAPKRAATLH